uniref:Uncharacterized protein n=1 Tax=Rhizophora mucronata TaxID=61149 RepID=A0A2P2NBZ2_RHIMU
MGYPSRLQLVGTMTRVENNCPILL